MHRVQVDAGERAAGAKAAVIRAVDGAVVVARLAGDLDGLLGALLDALVALAEVVCAAVLEGELQLEGGVLGGDIAAGHGLNDGGPDVGAEEGRIDVGVVEVEDGGGEGLQRVGWRGGQVDDAATGEMDAAGAACDVEGLLARVLVERLQRQGGARRRGIQALLAGEQGEALGGREHDPAVFLSADLLQHLLLGGSHGGHGGGRW